MKKKRDLAPKQPLRLAAESIRQLQPGELTSAAGGSTYPYCVSASR